MTNKTLWGILGAIVVVVLIIYGVSVNRDKNDEVKIGFVGPLTGDAAVFGDPISKAAALAAKEINAAGGVNGRPLKIVFENGLCNGKDAAQAMQKLIGIDGVKLIVGGSCSGEILAMAPLSANGEAVLISPSATSPKITTAGDFVFRNAPSDALQAAVMARYAYQKLGLKRGAIISENTDYAQGLREAFKKGWTDFGGQIIADETYNSGETDFRTLATKLIKAEPEFIYIVPQTPAAGSLLGKQLHGIGFQGTMLTAEAMASSDTAKESALEGMIMTEPAFAPGSRGQQLLAAYKAEYGAEPDYKQYVANTYDIVYLFKSAVASVGQDTAKVRDWLYGLKDWQGAGGSLTFDKNGDPVSATYTIKKIHNKELVEVETITP